MSDPAILFVKPKAISQRDKKALQTAGVIVVEVDDVNNVKFTRAAVEISSSEMLGAAMSAIAAHAGEQTKSAFIKALAVILETRVHPHV